MDGAQVIQAMQMYKTQQETYNQVIDEIKPLLHEHWLEIALNKDTVLLDPDYELYQLLEVKGMLHITTIRDEGKLIGYAIYVISPNIHYKSLKVAESDIFFLKKDYRNMGVGKQLLIHAEKHLVSLGVNKIINRVKLNTDAGYVFEIMGHKPIEKVYSKLVGI